MSIAYDDPEYPSTPGLLQTDTLADSVLILLGLTVVQRLVGFVRAILFCRWLDADQLGQWDMAFSFLVLAAPLSVLAIPGAFGRYLEQYCRLGQMHSFLRRMILCCGGLAALSLTGIMFAREWFSELLFGSKGESNLVVVTAVCLLAVIAYNFLIEFFTALRNIRLASSLQFINSIAFAVAGMVLLVGWDCSARSVVMSYGASCLLAIFCAWQPLRRVWRAAPQAAQPMPHVALWTKVIPFIGWILLGSVLINLFGVLDRYMIVHFSSIPATKVMDVIGNYHSSRVVPTLLISIATMLSVMLLPHLSHDWEAGRRAQVATKLRLFLKLFGFALYAAAVAVLIAAPLLFGVAFRHKFPIGEAVLPLTLLYSTWFGMFVIVQAYLLCAEHARLPCVALFSGLLLNVVLNLLLVPRLGLEGAVLATTAANGLALGLLCAFNHRLGFRLDSGARLVLVLPLFLALGPWIAAVAILLVIIVAIVTDRLLSPEEKRRVTNAVGRYKERFRLHRWLARRRWHANR